MSDRFDLVVIGSGPAGEKGAAQVAYFGKRVALVEKEQHLGGACANTGTLPSKTLRESAIYLSGLRQRDIYGVNVMLEREISIGDFMRQKEIVVAREREREAANLARHDVEIVRGTARFADANTVRVEIPGKPPRYLKGDVILVATGSSPRRPKEIPFDDPDVDDSDEILHMDRIPKSFIVVGGGVIGSEYASILAGLGRTKVTLVEARDRILNFIDDEIGEHLTQAFRRMGIEVILGESITQYEKPAPRHVRVTLSSGRVLDAERLLAAAGRTGNTKDLGLNEIGVALDERGLIKVDRTYRTSVPHVYAAGDVIGAPSLVSTGMEQARIAMRHAFKLDGEKQLERVFPYGLYTIPEAAMIGDTEAEAVKKGFAVEVGRSFYADNARGQIINDPDGMMKLVFDRTTKKLLGAHILGERATDLIHVAQAVMAFGGTIDYFVESVFNYPTLGELYKYAAYDGLGKLRRL
ncbi:MAG: Si-specific NAD(P)(+) transhydrogenase [Deltaproteobacteria bacterium]|nr:Si-specific NAD(P)(+) transhydrogenase [Deltaproteobacteria bacterium]MCW5805015.1 Si-specific NAD(P)(+) transhydrogenase [Deltaproteobacteria bacterium]